MNENGFDQKFSSLSETYIKFLVYHSIIIFTIVVTLLNAVNSVKNKGVHRKVDDVFDLAIENHILPIYAVHDTTIANLYFSDLDTTKYRVLYSKDTLPPQLRAIENDQIRKIQEIEDITDNAFLIKLSFLGDVTVDLRSWIYILPFIFLISCIYIFIQDYKISLIKRTASFNKSPVRLTDQYPFKFLRLCFLFFEFFLLIIYGFIIFRYFERASPSIFTTVVCAIVYFLYYGLIYCLFIAKNMTNDFTDGRLSITFINRAINICRKIYGVISKRNPLSFFTLGQASVFITLFVALSWKCNQTDLKGYQLIVDKNSYWQDAHNLVGAFYKYLYLVALFASLAIFLYYKRELVNDLLRKLKKSVALVLVALIIFFSMYFGVAFFDVLTDRVLIPSACLFFLFWMRNYYLKGDEKSILNKRQVFIIVVYLFPFIVVSVLIVLAFITELPGLILLYFGLWLLLLGIVVQEKA
jgi:hypothetical protein